MSYLTNPDEIYQRSFEMINQEVDLSVLPEQSRPVAERVIHACGMPEILPELKISPDLVKAVTHALANGAPILVDAEMLKSAIIPRMLPKSTKVICELNHPTAAKIGKAKNITRSAAAVELWGDKIKGAVVVIGNAPTALFRLLELIDEGTPKPAAIIAFPVGFVGAAESKQVLDDNPRGIPYATLLGRKGGTAMAGAAVNAITRGMKK
jgi:precorrin-8X/cobalt-precorrin-8 methylmutase